MLVENPDSVDLWERAEILRHAGYQVATCTGPTTKDGTRTGANDQVLRCPLVDGAGCSLVEEADVVVTTCALGQSREILAALVSNGSRRVLFELPAPLFDRYRDTAGTATLVPFPVTEGSLRAAVAAEFDRIEATDG